MFQKRFKASKLQDQTSFKLTKLPAKLAKNGSNSFYRDVKSTPFQIISMLFFKLSKRQRKIGIINCEMFPFYFRWCVKFV